jgi:tripartite-type tricarboxylate transporter receptor subunit TctC
MRLYDFEKRWRPIAEFTRHTTTLETTMTHRIPQRRQALRGLFATLAVLPLPLLAQDKPIEWVVGYAAGGGSDAVARIVAEAMSASLARTIVVNNKPGAATNIAADSVAKSRDLGNVLFTADFATLAANQALFAKLPYDADKDFKPVGLLARFPLLLVAGPATPAQDWASFVAWAKAQPQGVNYASAGPGSPHHLAGELLRERSGLNLQHVPYRGAAPALQDLIGGQVAVGVIDTAAAQPHLAGGRLRVLGVATRTRLKSMPNVPTLAEQGLKDFEAFAWQGLVVPAGTSDSAAAKFSQALQAALASPAVKSRFESLGVEPMPGSADEMARFARAERERWGRLIRANGIRLD